MAGLAGIDWAAARHLAEADDTSPWATLAAYLRAIERGALEGARRKAAADAEARKSAAQSDEGGAHDGRQ